MINILVIVGVFIVRFGLNIGSSDRVEDGWERRKRGVREIVLN